MLGFVLAALALSPTSQAVEGGSSNYVPGTYGDFAMALAPSAKLTLRNDFYYYSASGDGSMRAGRRELGVDLTLGMNLTTLIFNPEAELFGAQYAFGAVVPIVHADLDSVIERPGLDLSLQDDTTGLGDIALFPLMLFWTGEKFHFALSQAVVMPTGRYDTNRLVNPGLNYWSFDTNFAMTYLNPDTGNEISFNLGYLYNTENSATDYHSGQELHLDVALNKYLSESFAVGLQGFFVKQVTGDSGEGAALGDFEGHAAGLGPAVLWNTQIKEKPVTFIAKWLHEVEAEKRLKGDHFFLSFVMQF